MKKCVFSVIFLLICNISIAQRLAYVDSDYVLKHVPEYSSAQKQLNDLSVRWQKDIDKKFVEVDDMYKAYQADQVLLTEDMRKRREQEIEEKEKEAKELQQKRFGYEGELYQHKLKLIKPIQEKIGKAIEEYASREGLDIIIDKSSITMLYARPNFDRSNDIITRLGYKPGSFAK